MVTLQTTRMERNMDYPILYRERIIPKECVLLKNDEILSYQNQMLITKWNALKPRPDLHHGYSCYFFKEGYKISKFYKEDGSLLYWYCDIIDHTYDSEKNTLIVTDLLADVIIYPDGFVKVADIEEIVTALEDGGLSIERLKKALISLGKLLDIVYNGKFDKLTAHIEVYEQ